MLRTVLKRSISSNEGKILTRYKLRLCDSQKMRYQQKKRTIIRDLINLKEDVIQKKKLDPRVDNWKEFLIYSDYVLQRSLKFGRNINSKIINEMKQREQKLEHEKLMKSPALSITLKYFKDDVEKNSEKEIDGVSSENVDASSENEEDDSKPIYMPYAAEDSFKEIEKEEPKPVIEDNKPILNEKYKVLYEKYLESLKNTEEDSGELKNKLNLRLGDDLSKVPNKWMTDYETFDDKFEQESWEAFYGTANPNSTVSSIPCGGCGALLHCKDSEIPGYLPSELFENQNDQVLQSLICQRCHFMKFYKTALDVKVSPEDYPKLLSAIKEKKCAVILMVDLTDFPSCIWPDISSIIGTRTPVFVVGNKIDLLPQDSPTFFQHVQKCLYEAILDAGISERNIRHVSLVSAKSGFGIEELINTLQNWWRHRGDVYLVGCTNVGKSSLFNTLLQSDYCKVQAVDLVQRATTSPWPGTTLCLLKFPLCNPQSWRLLMRKERLMEETRDKHMEIKLRRHQFHVSKNILLATLQGRIGRSFKVPQNSIARENFLAGSHTTMTMKKFGIDENLEEFKNSKWVYDTPGSIQPDQILHLLTTDELLMTLPRRIIIPRTFVIHEGETLFLAGIGRIDFTFVPTFLRITVFSSNQLPLTICQTVYADKIYSELLETEAFGVPVNKPERLKIWPELRSKDFHSFGISEQESSADVVLSSAGWVALTPPENEKVSVKAWTPEGRGLFLRTPALLRKSVNLRGARVNFSPAYKKGKAVYVKESGL